MISNKLVQFAFVFTYPFLSNVVVQVVLEAQAQFFELIYRVH